MVGVEVDDLNDTKHVVGKPAYEGRAIAEQGSEGRHIVSNPARWNALGASLVRLICVMPSMFCLLVFSGSLLSAGVVFDVDQIRPRHARVRTH